MKRVTARITNRTTGTSSKTITFEAPIVVLSGGAVGTPVLLQKSGLGGGGVGHWLRAHPTTALLAHYDHDVVGSSGIPLSANFDHFNRWNDTDYGFWIQCPLLHPALCAVATRGFGAEHAADLRKFRKLGAFMVLTRDGSKKTHSSGSVLVDKTGITRIKYRLAESDGLRTRAALEAATRMHFAVGAKAVRTMHTKRTVIQSPNYGDFKPNHGVSSHELAQATHNNVSVASATIPVHVSSLGDAWPNAHTTTQPLRAPTVSCEEI